MLKKLIKLLHDITGREYINIELRVDSDGEGTFVVDYNHVFVMRLRENFGFQGTSVQVVDAFINMIIARDVMDNPPVEDEDGSDEDDYDDMGMMGGFLIQ